MTSEELETARSQFLFALTADISLVEEILRDASA